MRKLTKLLAFILLLCIAVSTLASCDVLDQVLGMLGLGGNQPVDYAGSVVLDWTSESAKCEVQSVKTYKEGE